MAVLARPFAWLYGRRRRGRSIALLIIQPDPPRSGGASPFCELYRMSAVMARSRWLLSPTIASIFFPERSSGARGARI